MKKSICICLLVFAASCVSPETGTLVSSDSTALPSDSTSKSDSIEVVTGAANKDGSGGHIPSDILQK